MQIEEGEKVIKGHRQNMKYFYMTAVILKKSKQREKLSYLGFWI